MYNATENDKQLDMIQCHGKNLTRAQKMTSTQISIPHEAKQKMSGNPYKKAVLSQGNRATPRLFFSV